MKFFPVKVFVDERGHEKNLGWLKYEPAHRHMRYSNWSGKSFFFFLNKSAKGVSQVSLSSLNKGNGRKTPFSLLAKTAVTVE